MDLPIFQGLCQLMREGSLLHDTRRVKIEEQLVMFLFIVGHSARNRLVQERFQHSGETISRYFNQVLYALKRLSSQFIRLPLTTTPMETLRDSRFHPYFKVIYFKIMSQMFLFFIM